MGAAPAAQGEPDQAESPLLPTRTEWLDLARKLGAASLAGLAAGFAIGGVGGRLAMFVLRLTSPDSLRGVATDDGFDIGSFTTDTIGFVVFAAVAGALFAVPYLVVRWWLPERRRPIQAAVFFGLVGGAAVIEPGGVDFTFIDPQVLAIVLFIALPAVYGVAMAVGTEWLLDRPDRYRRARYLALIPLLVGGPLLVAIIVVLAAAVLAGRHWAELAVAIRGPVVTWGVRIVLLSGMALGLRQLLSDVTEIL